MQRALGEAQYAEQLTTAELRLREELLARLDDSNPDNPGAPSSNSNDGGNGGGAATAAAASAAASDATASEAAADDRSRPVFFVGFDPFLAVYVPRRVALARGASVVH